MEQLVSELKKKEKQSIIEVMAFMSYNPSIGRVLEKGGVKKFQNMVISKVTVLTNIKNTEDFDTFHKQWMSEFMNNIKTNSGDICSYGQAQKAINVFLKLLVKFLKQNRYRKSTFTFDNFSYGFSKFRIIRWRIIANFFTLLLDSYIK